ncbi:MAG: ornithine carbamoyltransferase, partial [candidate division WOR-3 bacterium]
MKKDLVTIADLSRDEIYRLFDLALRLKSQIRQQGSIRELKGRVMALIFEKPSLRTRVTFETGMIQLGGAAIYLAPADVGLGRRESVPDVARNLSSWVNVIVARTFAHETITDLADNASIPVINALDNLEHPCQVLADFLTLFRLRKRLPGAVLTWVGDGNNVCHSLILAAGLLGVNLRIATPVGYEPKATFLELGRKFAAQSGSSIELFTEPRAAVRDTEYIYTDVWTSMGDEDQAEERRRAFAAFQVNAALLAQAGRAAKVMHCL